MIDQQWWNKLTDVWKRAFAEAVFLHNQTPSESELQQLFLSPALRLVGPTAPYPNLSFKLSDLSAVAALVNLETLVVTHHQISDLSPLQNLTQLKHLFLMNNLLVDLDSLRTLRGLRQLYVQNNCITSLLPLQNLIGLEELYVHHNRITSLDGLTEAHSDSLVRFFCLPNDGLNRKQLLKVEREWGLSCRSVQSI